jgi:hypothetical protein
MKGFSFVSGVIECAVCDEITSRKCCVDSGEEKEKICLVCHRDNFLVEPLELKTTAAMKEELLRKGQSGPFDATNLKILELYEAYKGRL